MENWAKFENKENEVKEIFNRNDTLHLITDNIFGFYTTKTDNGEVPIQCLYYIQQKLKELNKNCKILAVSFTEGNGDKEAMSIFDEVKIVPVDFKMPPVLKKMVQFCDSIFEWLCIGDDQIVLILSIGTFHTLLLMVHAYSRFYDSMSRKDLKRSTALKAFVNSNMTHLQNSPTSYRRYADYMCLYSYMNRLSSLCTSVQLFGIILSYFPSMHSDSQRTTDIFFKIYTRNPLKCSHTTKTYQLPKNINRLVILFDQYPISLYEDVMIIAYHKYPITGRQRLFRLNFHCCQATSDALNFIANDLEDVYPSCPLKMKLDLYFRATMVCEDDNLQCFDESKTSTLSPIQKFDSFSDFRNCKLETELFMTEPQVKRSSVASSGSPLTPQTNQLNQTSITLMKAKVDDYRTKATPSAINQRGHITGPVDSYHSTKLDSVRTSTTILNGNNDEPDNNLNSDRKMNELILDINKNTKTPATYESRYKYGSLSNIERHTAATNNNLNNTDLKSVNNREVQLMNELMDAKREINNLKQSINSLDVADVPNRNNVGYNSSNFVRNSNSNSFRSNQGERFTNSNKLKLNEPVNKTRIPPTVTTNKSINITNNSVNKSDDNFHSTGYSAHRENLERERAIKNRFYSEERIEPVQKNPPDNVLETNDILEEVETINLQPIGKGIQDLTGPRSMRANSATGGNVRVGSENFVDNVSHHQYHPNHTFSPPVSRHAYTWNKQSDSTLNTNKMGSRNVMSPGMSSMAPIGSSTGIGSSIGGGLSHHTVEERIHLWYRPNITREETIQILKVCRPGSFLIRDSNTYSGAFGLAVKVAHIPPNIPLKSNDLEAEKVRHYLIEPAPGGVAFKGFPEEPAFSSLTALVTYYTKMASVLPCTLILPTAENSQPLLSTNTDVMINRSLQQQQQHQPPQDLPVINTADHHQSSVVNNHSLFSPTRQRMSQPQTAGNKGPTGYRVCYLGCYDVEFITGPSVINKAVERLIADLDSRRFTECQMQINTSGNPGIVLTDLERKLFFRRHHSFSNITYCGLDPRDRKIELDLCKSNGIKKTKVFGMIVKEYIADESKCFLFGELDPAQKSSSIVDMINKNLRLQQK